jgi:undecaprenyl-diphosphatase
MSESDFQPLIDWLTVNPNWVLLTIASIAFVESLALAGIVVPGVLLLFMVAAVAGNVGLALWPVLMAGFFGAVAGDILSFYIGHHFKNRLDTHWPFSRYPKAIEAGKSFFTQHGGKSVVIGRFVGPIRPVLPLVAGIAGMSQIRFISFNLASAVAWSPLYILPGYIAGTATQLVLPEHFLPVITGLILTIILAVLALRYFSLKLQKGSAWYDALELRKQNSPLFDKVWRYFSHPRDPSREFPLASLTLFLITFTLFWIWSLITLHFGLLREADEFLLHFASKLRSEYVDAVLITLTLLGDELFLYFSFAIFVFVMLFQRTYIAAIHLVVAGLSTAIITHGFKFWFSVARPELVLIPPESFAYPSGHSSGAAVFYGLIASFFAQERARLQRWKIYTGFGLPILLIALSRVLLGVHWLSDIIGGILLGLALCGLTRAIYSRYQARDTQNARGKQLSVYSGLVFWLCTCIAYQYFHYHDAFNFFRVS